MSEFLVCEECGIENNTVEARIDPYIRDLFGEEIEIIVCDNCYTKMSDDI